MSTGVWARISAALCLLLGLVTVIAGGWLALLGGSAYYLLLGVALVADAVLLWRGQRFAYPLYALILVATMIWALCEVGFDFWPLAPRGDILVPFGLWLLAPWVVRSFPAERRPWRMPLVGAVVASIIIVGIALATTNDDVAGRLPTAVVGALPQTDADAVPDDEWHAYGRTGAGDHFSPLTQITPANVANPLLK